MINCIDCKYYVPDKGAIERRRKGGKGNGKCHRRAPETNHSYAYWPNVNDNDFCGEGEK